MTSDYPRISFGANADQETELAQLISDGIKTATYSALSAYQSSQTPLPKVGQRFIVVDGKGQDQCIIELTAVAITRFCDVDEDFAHAEGEGDRSLEYWRQEHQRFFEANGEFSEDMQLVQEWFHVANSFKA